MTINPANIYAVLIGIPVIVFIVFIVNIILDLIQDRYGLGARITVLAIVIVLLTSALLLLPSNGC
jgi:hypothetical protein